MDSGTFSIIDHQRTYYFNGTYDEVISNDQPKPPPMFPHGDDIHAVPSKDDILHKCCRQKWSERRKNRDNNNKRKRMGTEKSASTTPLTVLTAAIAAASTKSISDDNANVDDDAIKALPASAIPEGFPEELVFRTLAAYATIRTLSVQLRLSPFTPTAFLRAIYLPYPNRLLGSVHVHILRILLHNLQMGYNWKETSTTLPPPLDIVKKRKIDHIKWPLRAGDNLRFLDLHTWPIFYDDYCHLTADITYASLHDILDHIDLRALNLHNIVDRFTTTTSTTTGSENNNNVPKLEHQYLREDPHHDESFDDVIVMDSDEDYKVEDDDDHDHNDAFDYDDEDYGRSKKKKRNSKSTTKPKQPKSLPKMSTTTGTKGTTTIIGIAKTTSALPIQQQHSTNKKTNYFSQQKQSALGVKIGRAHV